MEKFSKYEALGNDFVLLDRRAQGGDIDAAQARRLCDRHLGVGADGVLVLLPAEGVDAKLRIHNSDGSVAQMCGNGLRCVARHLSASLGAGRPLRIGTDVGVREARLESGGRGITVEIGPALFEAAQLPRAPGGGPFVEQTIDGQLASAVSVGNPHLVLLEAKLDDVTALGPKLEHFPGFPERTNVEFCRQQAAGGLEVRVWERGAGYTQACGSGAGAAVAAYVRAGRLPADKWHPVTLPGGTLEVRFDSADARVWLRGDASRVFEGTFTR